MTQSFADQENWERLESLVRGGEAPAVEAFLESLPPGEAARSIVRLHAEEQSKLLRLLDPDDAADLMEQMPESQAAEMLERLEPDSAAAIVQELPSDERADLLGSLDEEEAEAILNRMQPAAAQEARVLSSYEDDVAGGLMVTEYLAFPESGTVADIHRDLEQHAERYRDYVVQYSYVIDARGGLVGVLRLRDLLLAPREQKIGNLMIRAPKTVRDTSTLDELRSFFGAHAFFGVPVVDARGVLLGLVQRSDVEQAQADRTGTDYLKSQGIVGGEELRTMPFWQRSRRRLAWLSINIGLNVVAASVIAFYQETLAAVIALAVFLPIISDMSGCSGNQAVAVSMRELSLGLVRPAEVFRVWLKEISVGVINGLALGALIAAVAWAWKGNPVLGLVVGTAMALNTMLAVSIGGTLPLVLRRFRMDPALASGPILTTVTDMCGFFLLLSLATVFLPRLVG